MEALAPGFAPAEVVARRPARRRGLDRARRPARARAGRGGRRRASSRVEVPWPDGVYPAFAREIAEVHADLYPATASATARASRARWTSRARSPTQRPRPRRRARALPRADRRAATIDLLVTPTLPMVAPPTGVGDLALRERMIELTFPWNVTGSPALALPCGPAEDGLRPRCSWSAGRARTRSCSRRPGARAQESGQRLQRRDDRRRRRPPPAPKRGTAGMLPPRCCAHSSTTCTSAAPRPSSAAARSGSPASTRRRSSPRASGSTC